MGRLINRAADRWRPLYAIADLAAGRWPEAVRAAMSALSADDDDSSGEGERLVRDIHRVLGDWIAEHPDATEHEIASAEVTDRLVALPASRWAEMGRARKPLTSVRLARMLAPFKVRPIDIGPRDDRRKGYRLTDFEPVFARILGEGGVNSRTRAKPQKTATFSRIKLAHNQIRCASLKSHKPAEIRRCARVRDLKARPLGKLRARGATPRGAANKPAPWRLCRKQPARPSRPSRSRPSSTPWSCCRSTSRPNTDALGSSLNCSDTG